MESFTSFTCSIFTGFNNVSNDDFYFKWEVMTLSLISRAKNAERNNIKWCYRRFLRLPILRTQRLTVLPKRQTIFWIDVISKKIIFSLNYLHPHVSNMLNYSNVIENYIFLKFYRSRSLNSTRPKLHHIALLLRVSLFWLFLK